MSVSTDDHIPKVVDCILDDWMVIAKLIYLLEDSNWLEKFERSGLVSLKNFTWNKLIINYGPNRSAVATIQYIITEKYYKLSFGKRSSDIFNCFLYIIAKTIYYRWTWFP